MHRKQEPEPRLPLLQREHVGARLAPQHQGQVVVRFDYQRLDVVNDDTPVGLAGKLLEIERDHRGCYRHGQCGVETHRSEIPFACQGRFARVCLRRVSHGGMPIRAV